MTYHHLKLPFQEAASNLYHSTENLENTEIDHLLLVSKLSLFTHIEQVAKDVIRTRTFRGNSRYFVVRFIYALFSSRFYYTVMHNNYTFEPLGIQNARKDGRQVEVLATRVLKDIVFWFKKKTKTKDCQVVTFWRLAL